MKTALVIGDSHVATGNPFGQALERELTAEQRRGKNKEEQLAGLARIKREQDAHEAQLAEHVKGLQAQALRARQDRLRQRKAAANTVSGSAAAAAPTAGPPANAASETVSLT